MKKNKTLKGKNYLGNPKMVSPFGPFICRSVHVSYFIIVSFVNIKHCIFSVIMIKCYLNRTRPDLIINITYLNIFCTTVLLGYLRI